MVKLNLLVTAEEASMRLQPFGSILDEVVLNSARWEFLTDSNRSKSMRSPSGMGGVMIRDGRRVWPWCYEFSAAAVIYLPVHVTEFIAYIVQLRLSLFMCGKSEVAEFNDNMAVVWSIIRGKAADIRFKELLLLRNVMVIESGAKRQMSHVKSENNDMADPLSRLDFERFWKAVHKSTRQS